MRDIIFPLLVYLLIMYLMSDDKEEREFYLQIGLTILVVTFLNII